MSGPPSDDGATFDAVADVLADDVASGILRAAYDDPMTAHQLADALDTSPPTVYRRLEELAARDLVTASTRPDPDGHHTDVYRANLAEVVVTLDADGFAVDVTRRDTMADRFTTIVEEM